MKQRISSIRGFPDRFGEGIDVIESAFKRAAKAYDFQRIRTPILEPLEVFTRSVDELVVSKELFSFQSRSGKHISLRPENTAGVVRALLQSDRLTASLSPSEPLKYFYSGPMFRYERPQKGRFRQFNQFGVELLGSEDPNSDIDVIALASDCLNSIGLEASEHFTLQLNSLGDSESMMRYEQVLKEYLNRHSHSLSERSRERLKEGKILRFLDSKADADIEFRNRDDFPLLTNHLNDVSQQKFQDTLEGLTRLGIQCQVCPTLVRGLDYYSHTAFEFVTKGQSESHLGPQQGTILAGGRYDQLVSDMGGPNISGVGWAAGIDRLVMLLEQQQHDDELDNIHKVDIAVVAVRDSCSSLGIAKQVDCEAMKVCHELRREGISVHFSYVGKTRKQMQIANRRAASVLIVGEDELREGSVLLKQLSSGNQVSCPREDLQGIKAFLGQSSS